MVDEGAKALDAFFVDDVEPGPHVFALVRAPRRVPFSDLAQGDARATIGAIAAAALQRVDKHRPRESQMAAAKAFTHILVQAAIAAAKSDRHLTSSDLADATAHMSELGVSDATTRFLRDEILRPEMMDHLTCQLATRDEMVEVYVVSRLAADVGSGAADHYLRMLSARLGLEQALTDAVEAIIGETQMDDR